MLRVFGKKSAAQQAENQFLQRIQNEEQNLVISVSTDQESTIDGQWCNASDLSSCKLSKNIKEPRKLVFFPGAVCEITFNKPGKFSQSQLAVLCQEDMPSQSDVDNFCPINVTVAPEGCKSIPSNNFSKQDLLHKGWKETSISQAPIRAHKLGKRGSIYGRRYQYGLEHRIASTIHATMGQNLHGVVTQVSKSNAMYSLWQREQIVLLLSRTNFAKDIILVGSPDQTANALSAVLQTRSKYTDYICHILDTLSKKNRDPFTIDLTLHPYRPVDVELPSDDSGYAYMLISLRDQSTAYFGQTKNLRRRLKEHNSGFGSKQTTSSSLRPWALMAFVCGFGGCRHAHQHFETLWRKERIMFRQNNGRAPTLDQLADLAKVVMLQFQNTDNNCFLISQSFPPLDLRFVKCGTFDI